MAHIGKLYRLTFRRDLAMNVPNYLAYADKYSTDLLTLLGQPILGAAQPRPWLSDSGVESSPNVLTWLSSPIAALGANWHYEMTALQPWMFPGDNDRRFQLKRNGATVYQLDWFPAVPQRYNIWDKTSQTTVTINNLGAFGVQSPFAWHIEADFW